MKKRYIAYVIKGRLLAVFSIIHSYFVENPVEDVENCLKKALLTDMNDE